MKTRIVKGSRKRVYPAFLILAMAILLAMFLATNAYASDGRVDIEFYATFEGMPLDGVQIRIGTMTALTNIHGIAVFNVEPGEYEYTITKEEFIAVTGTTEANDYTPINVEMELANVQSDIIPISIGIGIVIILLSLIAPKQYKEWRPIGVIVGLLLPVLIVGIYSLL